MFCEFAEALNYNDWAGRDLLTIDFVKQIGHAEERQLKVEGYKYLHGVIEDEAVQDNNLYGTNWTVGEEAYRSVLSQ